MSNGLGGMRIGRCLPPEKDLTTQKSERCRFVSMENRKSAEP